MSEYAGGGAPAKEKDPLLRFLAGCAIVIGALAAIVIGGCGFFAWRLVREENPGRPVEAMLLGDETRYWCFELAPDDAGLVAMVDRFDKINVEARDRALEGTPFKGLPLPRRRADVHEILPLKVELSLGPGEAPVWAARATMTKGTLRMRAALKVMRWAMSKDTEKTRTVDVDGVEVTVLEARRLGEVAFATVGNRVLASGGIEPIRRMLGTPQGETPAALAGIPEFHRSMKLDGEDGWAFAAATEVEGPARRLPLLGAVASFDLAADDALHVRIEVPATDGAGLDTLTAEEATAILASFFLGRAARELTLDEGFPRRSSERTWRIEGRVSDLSSRFASLFGEWPSATPTDPSPPPTSGPRSDTPSEPPRGGTPTPAR